MCVTTRKERENDRPKAILSSKTNSLPLYVIFSQQSPKNRGRGAYDIIQKAYWINEKKIEMLDFEKSKKVLENYYEYLIKKENKDEKH